MGACQRRFWNLGELDCLGIGVGQTNGCFESVADEG